MSWLDWSTTRITISWDTSLQVRIHASIFASLPPPQCWVKHFVVSQVVHINIEGGSEESVTTIIIIDAGCSICSDLQKIFHKNIKFAIIVIALILLMRTKRTKICKQLTSSYVSRDDYRGQSGHESNSHMLGTCGLLLLLRHWLTWLGLTADWSRLSMWNLCRLNFLGSNLRLLLSGGII